MNGSRLGALEVAGAAIPNNPVSSAFNAYERATRLAQRVELLAALTCGELPPQPTKATKASGLLPGGVLGSLQERTEVLIDRLYEAEVAMERLETALGVSNG